MLASLERRPDLNLGCQHGIGRSQHGGQQDGAGECQPGEQPNHGDGNDADRHGDRQQAHGRTPQALAANTVDPNARPE